MFYSIFGKTRKICLNPVAAVSAHHLLSVMISELPGSMDALLPGLRQYYRTRYQRCRPMSSILFFLNENSFLFFFYEKSVIDNYMLPIYKLNRLCIYFIFGG
jgi:hypothetical protein